MLTTLVRLFARLIITVLFRFRIHNREVLAAPGPVLLIPNHVTWIDWLFLIAYLDDDWKFVTSHETAQTTWFHHQIMVNRYTFPVDTTSPYVVRQMAEFLKKGGRLVLFAEGRLSRTGVLMKLFDGVGFLLHKTEAKVITCYLRGAHRQKLAVHGGWRRWFPTISLHCGELLTPPRLGEVKSSVARRRLTLWVYDRITEQQFAVEMQHGEPTIPRAVRAMARQLPRLTILEDVTLHKLTYRSFFVGVEIFTDQWRRRLRAETPRVGILLPNSNALVVTLFSLWSAGKVPAILNFSSGAVTVIGCCRLAGVTQVITLKPFLDRMKLDPRSFRDAGLELIFIDEIREEITGLARLAALCRFRLGGAGRAFRRDAARWSASDTAIILFTSGSEGVPKGVELTHRNLLANIRQVLAVTDIVDSDRLFTALPMFHSFGITVGTLLPLVRGLFTFVYPSPLHFRLVPMILYDRDCTILLGTNTFLNGYARRAHPYDFRSLRYLFAGAEKLQTATADIWARVFGVRILEGYGATECSPTVSVNTALHPRFGSAGKLLPGMEYRLEPVPGVEVGGRLRVRGPNVMKGYLNAEANAAFQALGGWYDTGDIVTVDEDGFITIQGRAKRFAKVSGEMVSLTAVEEALAGAFPQLGPKVEVAVVTRPDERKGEALVAVTNDSRLTLELVRAVLHEQGFTPLAWPRKVVVVRRLPKLGTGKADYRELTNQLAAMKT